MSSIPKTGNAFLDSVAADAIESQRATRVPASVTLAQAALESSWGKSGLSMKYHNYFGIKGKGPAGTAVMSTGEHLGGKDVVIKDGFRVYRSAAESFEDHGRFFLKNKRYAEALRHTDDAERFAKEIHKAGYATDPSYSQKLIKLIRQYKLERFDEYARGQMAVSHGPFQGPAQSPSQGTSHPAGSSHQAVRELQSLLVKFGYMTEQQVQTGPGILGPKTRTAVARFLSENGRLAPSGTGTATTGGTVAAGGATPGKNPKNIFPTKSAAMIDGVPLYKQGDKNWGKTYLGSANNLTIHAAGCAMTSTAMAISKISGRPINPKELDDYLDHHSGYSGNGLVWTVAAKARGLRANRLHNGSLVTLDKELAAGRPVVAGVDYKKGSGGGGNGTDHWVTITGKYSEGAHVFYTAHDPATGEKCSFKAEGNLLRASRSTGALHDYVTTGEFCLFSPEKVGVA
ncbi:glucosaminidase domain-containing protein [Cystobacter fuscus]